jgi:hypothetical protein
LRAASATHALDAGVAQAGEEQIELDRVFSRGEDLEHCSRILKV